MQLPYKPDHVMHRHGGTVTEIAEIKIQLESPSDGHSRDAWYFIGTVSWDDGTVSKGHPIDVPMLCSDTDAGQVEIRKLADLVMAHLKQHGTWNRAGPHEGWYANRPATAKRRTA